MNTRSKMIALLTSAVGLVSAANADLVDMRYVGRGQGRTVRITTPSSSFNVFAGQLRHVFSNGTGLGAQLSGEMITFCTDLTQEVTSSTRTYTILPLESAPVGGAMGSDKARAIASLYDYALGVQLEQGASADLACAFQLAVWEIVADYSWSLGGSSLSMAGGSFRATRTDGSPLWSGVTNYLNAFFFNTSNASSSTAGLAGVTSGSYQDQIVTVPAPGAAALAGLGMMLCIKRRRTA